MADLSQSECEQVLARNGVARLGCYSAAKEQSYVVPVAYAFQHGCITLALIPGQKLHYLTAHPKGVCLEVEELRKDDVWTTVVVTGDIVRIDREPLELESIGAERLPLRPMFDSGLTVFPPESLVYCELAIRELSGRQDRWEAAVARDTAELARIVGVFKSEHPAGD